MSGSLQGDPRQRRDLHPVRDRHQHPARGLRRRDCLRRSDQRLDSQRAARAGHAGRRHETQPGRRRLQGGRQPELRRRLGGDLLGQPLHHAGRQGRRVRPRGVVRRRAGAGDGRRHGRRRGYSDRRHRRQRLSQQEHGGQPQRFVRQGRRDGQRLHGLPRKPRRPLRLPPALRHAGGQRAGARHAPLALAQRHGPHARGESRTLHDQQPGRRKYGRKRCRRGDSRQAAPDFGTDRRRRLHLRLARKHRIPVQGGQLCQRLRKLQPFVRCQRLADGQQQPHGRLGVAADGRRGKFDLRTGQHALPLAAFGSRRPAGDGHDPRHRGAQRIAALRQRGALPDPRARRVGLRHGMGRGVGLYGVCRMGRQPSQILVRDLCQVQQPVCL